MDSQAGGDLAAGARAIEEHIVEKEQFEVDRKHQDEVEKEEAAKEQDNRRSDGSSSESGSDDLKKYDSKIVNVREASDDEDVFAHLPEHEKAILKKQLDMQIVSVSFTKLYRYATKWDLVIVAVSSFCAIGGGAVMPLMTVSWSTYLCMHRLSR